MFYTIEQIKRANAQRGHYFFERGAMRFFNSRILPTVYGGAFFITSEKDHWDGPRLYTIRQCLPNGEIETIGKFQQYETAAQARKAIHALLRYRTNQRIGA